MQYSLIIYRQYMCLLGTCQYCTTQITERPNLVIHYTVNNIWHQLHFAIHKSTVQFDLEVKSKQIISQIKRLSTAFVFMKIYMQNNQLAYCSDFFFFFFHNCHGQDFVLFVCISDKSTTIYEYMMYVYLHTTCMDFLEY